MLIPFPLEDLRDTLRWPHTRDGRITFRYAYNAIRNNNINSGAVDQHTVSSSLQCCAIWTSKVWPKVQTFMWKLASNSISVRSNLVRRGIPTSPVCPVCDEVETREHMAYGCSCTKWVWEGVLGLTMDMMNFETIVSWLCNMVSVGRGNRLEDQVRWSLCILTCWFIRKSRCKLAFEEKMPNSYVVIHDIFRAFEEIKVTWMVQPGQSRQPGQGH